MLNYTNTDYEFFRKMLNKFATVEESKEIYAYQLVKGMILGYHKMEVKNIEYMILILLE